MKTKVTILLIVRETYGFSSRVLEDLYRNTGIPFDLIYVAGGAPMADRLELEREAAARGFRLILRPYYLAPNEARNLALPYADTEYVVLLDNDTVVAGGWLEALLDCAEETGAAIVQPLVFLGKPEAEILHFFTGTCHLVEENGIRRVDERYPYHLKLFRELSAPLRRQPTEMVEYHCLLLRRTLLDRAGGFDEDLKSTRDHHDLSLLALQWREPAVAEPSARVCYLHPPSFNWREFGFFLVRWSPLWNRISHRRMDEKWQVTGSSRNRGFLDDHRRVHLNRGRDWMAAWMGEMPAKWLWETAVDPLEGMLADFLARRNQAARRRYLDQVRNGGSSALLKPQVESSGR